MNNIMVSTQTTVASIISTPTNINIGPLLNKTL